MNELAYEAMNKKDMPGYGWWISQEPLPPGKNGTATTLATTRCSVAALPGFYRKMAGLNSDQQEPGYKHIIIKTLSS